MSRSEPTSVSSRTIRDSSNPSGTAEWLFLVLFVVVSSGLFALFYEWHRYRLALQWNMLGVGTWAQITVVWLLWAKSVFIFIPLLAFSGLLIRLKLHRTAIMAFGLGWIGFFFWMAIDVDLLNYTGMHATDYLPYLYDIASSPEKNYGNWVAEDMVPQACLTFLAVCTAGYVLYRILKLGWVRWCNVSWRCVAAVVTVISLLVVCVIPALALSLNRRALREVCQAVPVAAATLEGPIEWTRRQFDFINLGRSSGSGVWIQSLAFLPDGRQRVTLRNPSKSKASLAGCRLQNSAAVSLPVNGVAPGQGSVDIDLDGKPLKLAMSGDHLFLIDDQGWVLSRVSFTAEDLKAGRTLLFDSNEAGPSDVQVGRESQDLPPGLLEPTPEINDVDASAAVAGSARPNVVIIVLESFRHLAVGNGVLRRLDALGDKGLVAQRHFSGSNCTQYGFFSLLYGRVALDYDETLNKQIAPRMTALLRAAGYRCTFTASGEYRGFRRMDGFINEETFDECFIADQGASTDYRTWPASDRKVFDKVRSLLTSAQGPQFILAYVYSTHYPYVFPPEFDLRKPSKKIAAYGLKLRSGPAVDMLNRYENAALFLEDEIVKLVESVDPARNLFVITGDHGESIGEDGVLGHGSLLSEIQLRVPLVAVGAGIKPKRISTATSHVDVLPTLLHYLCGSRRPLPHCRGRDLAEDDPPDSEILAVPWRWWDHKELLSFREERRRLFKVRKNNSKQDLAFSGLLDQFGRLE